MRKFLGPIAPALCALSAAGAWAQSSVATMHIVRDVRVSRESAVMDGRTFSYVPARDGQSLASGQAVRTLRRALAELDFPDRSRLRVNERTDLILSDAATLRTIQLHHGAVWVRVARGTNTRVATPTATAVARGTRFSVDQLEDGTFVLRVFEGTVDVERDGRVIGTLEAGQQIVIAPNGATRGAEPIPLIHRWQTWWETYDEQSRLRVSMGTLALRDLREDPGNESLQQGSVRANQAAAESPGDLTAFLRDLARRQIAPQLQNLLAGDPQLTLATFRQANDAHPVVQQFELGTSDAGRLSAFSIQTVGQLFDAMTEREVSLGIQAQVRHRVAYDPTRYDRIPDRSARRFFDRTDSHAGYLLAGLGLSLLGGRNGENPDAMLDGALFAQSEFPDLAGGRARLRAQWGATRLTLEGNAATLWTDSPRGSQFEALSVAQVERPVSENVTLFAGRRRFYAGPAFTNINLSQLIADRFTGAGVRARQGAWTIESAYVFDANPDLSGAQHGALASVNLKAGGGQFGVQYLQAPGLRRDHGASLTAAVPIVEQALEGYGEWGRAPDGRSIHTLGLYFPGLFQRHELDLAIEHSGHAGIGHSTTLAASRNLPGDTTLRLFADFRREDTRVGLGAVIRFGGKR